jgi:hypothetical protein
MRRFAASARAYTRLVLRLRAQAESEALMWDSAQGQHSRTTGDALDLESISPAVSSPPTAYQYPNSASRGPSDPGHGPALQQSYPPVSRPASRKHHRTASGTVSIAPSFAYSNHLSSNRLVRFRSPLYKPGHAPLLRVFVPSSEGQWLSDESVLQCEEELKNAEILSLLRVGDVIWDIAVGDEGNLGRMIWDGTYLIVSSLPLPLCNSYAHSPRALGP